MPMFTGLAKEPDASESCAVNTLPGPMETPLNVKGTATAAPGQKGLPVIVPVVIDWACTKDWHNKQLKNTKINLIDAFI